MPSEEVEAQKSSNKVQTAERKKPLVHTAIVTCQQSPFCLILLLQYQLTLVLTVSFSTFSQYQKSIVLRDVLETVINLLSSINR